MISPSAELTANQHGIFPLDDFRADLDEEALKKSVDIENAKKALNITENTRLNVLLSMGEKKKTLG